jgi:hypothetical protein
VPGNGTNATSGNYTFGGNYSDANTTVLLDLSLRHLRLVLLQPVVPLTVHVPNSCQAQANGTK